jgi:putative PIN family toxin of toxin-antitoxin system
VKKDKPAVVFDCMIFLQGLVKEKGVAVDCLESVESDRVKLFVSREILEEIADVLTRPLLQEKFSLLTKERVERLLEILRQKADLIKNVPRIFDYPRDPKDEKYIDLAVEAKADYIVSRDKDLLDLMTGFTDEVKEFRQKFRPLKVVEPLEFLEIIENREQK